MYKLIQRIRETINIRLYDSKDQVLKGLSVISLFAALGAISLIFYFYGFPHTDNESSTFFILMQVSFAFYIFRYFVRLVYDFSPREFLRKNWFEGILIVILIIDAISYNTGNQLIIQRLFEGVGLQKYQGISNLFLQVYMLIIAAADLKQKSSFLPKLKLHPATLFIVTFLILIGTGTALLMMPEMTIKTHDLSFVDALFTSTSATCVTGLIVVDTGTIFTFKGHLVILLLMKLGGLNIISFGSFLAFFGRLGVGIKHHDVVEDFVFKDSIFSSSNLLGKIIIGSIVFELIGTGMMFYILENERPEVSMGDNFFFSLFHSVSAFNNAGFSTVTDGLTNAMYSQLFMVHLVVAFLIFVGTLGFDTFFDIFDRKKMRERLKYPWKKPRVGSLLNIYTTLVLVIGGSILFFVFEKNGVMEGYGTSDSIITSIFSTISLRSAGFASVDFHYIAMPMLILTLVLMFIGGASSSTAGGIKTSTFSILVLSAYSIMRGKKNIEVFNRTIDRDIVFRAFSIFLFALFGVITGVFVLSITEQHILDMPDRSFMDLLFEQVSAFSTVGLSTGITAMLSSVGKVTLIISMFIGRLGTLTIAFALSKGVKSTNYKYPNEHMLVG